MVVAGWLRVSMCIPFLAHSICGPAIVWANTVGAPNPKSGSAIRAIYSYKASPPVNARSATKPAKVKKGWSFPVTPPPGDGAQFYVGPYHSLYGCRDMFGSAIYHHP